jgi:hypothetical protein
VYSTILAKKQQQQQQTNKQTEKENEGKTKKRVGCFIPKLNVFVFVAFSLHPRLNPKTPQRKTTPPTLGYLRERNEVKERVDIYIDHVSCSKHGHLPQCR